MSVIKRGDAFDISNLTLSELKSLRSFLKCRLHELKHSSMVGNKGCRFGFCFGNGKVAKAEIERRRKEIKLIEEKIKKYQTL